MPGLRIQAMSPVEMALEYMGGKAEIPQITEDKTPIDLPDNLLCSR